MIGMDIIADGVVAALLAATIWFAFSLNRRLGAMRAQQEELARLVLSLNQATARAQEGIYELKTVSQTSAETLKGEIIKARALADELAIITEAGNNLADRIETGLLRAPMTAGASGGPSGNMPSGKPAAVRLAAGRDLKDLLHNAGEGKRHALKAAR